MLLDHCQGKPSRTQLALGRSAQLVRSGPLVLLQQRGVLTVEADVAACVSGERPVQLLQRREKQLADAGPHVRLVRHVAAQRSSTEPDAGIQSEHYGKMLT